MASKDGDTLFVYSDYVCPFCYLGNASLKQFLNKTDVEPDIEWLQFDLRGNKRGPDGTIRDDINDGKDDEYFEQVWENVERLKEQYGVEMERNFSRDVDSWNAQKLAIYIQREHNENTFEQYHDEVFDALWKEEKDIGDPEVLTKIASSAGLPEDEIQEALENENLERELESRFQSARDQGITGVPSFVYDGHIARGAVPPEQLRTLVQASN